MQKLFTRMKDEESGQALILVALMMVVLLGIGSLVIDYGYMVMQKTELQTAADSAALAGAMSAIKPDTVINTAKATAKKNVSTLTDSNIVVDMGKVGDGEVTVTISQNAPKFFSGVITSAVTTISASATAKYIPQWSGEGLPFINLDFDYSTTDPIAWTQVGPGIKGTIQDFITKGSGPNTFFEVDFQNGIVITPGFTNGQKGLDDSKLKDGLDLLLTKPDENVKVVYLFSLRSDIIKGRTFTIINDKNMKETKSLDELNKLNNGDVIEPHQLVLIQCLFLGVDNYNNQHNIELKYLNKVYDLGNDVPGNPLPDFPTDYLQSGGNSARLIK